MPIPDTADEFIRRTAGMPSGQHALTCSRCGAPITLRMTLNGEAWPLPPGVMLEALCPLETE
jgi:hypothetical protein